MKKLSLPVELTKSRTGKHAARRIVVLVDKDGRTRIIGNPDKADRSVATYSIGTSGYVVVPNDIMYAVLFRLVRTPNGRIIGDIRVYDVAGRDRLEMVLKKRKLRRRCGDKELIWVVEMAVRALGLDKHIRRININTGC